MAVLERELLILLFSGAVWAWTCLGLFLANLTRTNRNAHATLQQAFTGQYLQPAPTVIIAIFIFFGSSFFLFAKAKLGASPYLFACVIACIALDVCLTTAVLFPFPYYLVGQSIMIPLSLHSAISLLCCIFIFPSSISAQYTARLQLVLSPLSKALSLHQFMLKTSPDSSSFASISTDIKKSVAQAEEALIPVAASARLLGADLVYSLYAPNDFVCLQQAARGLTNKAMGMGMYFALIDPTREKFLVTPAPSVPATPPVPGSPTVTSWQSSFDNARGGEKEESQGETSYEHPVHLDNARAITRGRGHRSATVSRSRSPNHSRHPSHHIRVHTRGHSHSSILHRAHMHHLHDKLLYLAAQRGAGHERAVGVFESQKYLNLEATVLRTPYAELYARQMLALLRESCDDLLGVTFECLIATRDWLGGVRKGRFNFWVHAEVKEKARNQRVHVIQSLRHNLSTELDRLRRDKRHRVLEPYRRSFEAKGEDADAEYEMPPHRYLFHCYVYQYQLMQFASCTLSMLDDILRLEDKRRRHRIWTPVKKLFVWKNWEVSEEVEHGEEENPDLIQGLEPSLSTDDLGCPRRRDPDALPPRNRVERISGYIYIAIASLFGGNVLYAIKAGVFTVVLCLPYFFKTSAEFAYRNRFVWAVFMGQVTLSRFRGDTAFAFVSRILATFWGSLMGMVVWYLSSCGNPEGNAYGLAVVFAVCLPLFCYARLYWPTAPLTNIVLFVTTVLVVGYSWENIILRLPGAPGVGFAVAWRRFVLVTGGVTAAFIVSFLPPSTTIRRYHRRMLATTCSELGTIYCRVLSFANSRKRTEVPEIVTNLLAIRNKLRRAQSMQANVRYEVTLRGRWPAKRYLTILEMQMQIGYALSHLMSVLEQLEPAWTRAFLRRTRFNDTDFQGDVLAVISMISTSLRSGQPLPQITPCPLLDRFMLRYHGLEVIHKEFQDDYGLPRNLTLDTLKNEQYMIFCAGVSTAFSIMTRLDRLMVAVKEVVGEQYHIHGIGLSRSGGVELGSRSNSVQFKGPENV
ncbi:hypothetical protein AX17_005887 [Amanita inopinata Kibby_2008]|nr:hypothetical protein AX17_005887 [Amanita inopinata Kibby_2008]